MAQRGGNPGEVGDNLPYVNLGTGRTASAVFAGLSNTCARLDNGAFAGARPNTRGPSPREKPRMLSHAGFHINSGGVLLSHAVTRAVPLALEGLTSEFGMGSGMTPPTLPPKTFESSTARPGHRAPASVCLNLHLVMQSWACSQP